LLTPKQVEHSYLRQSRCPKVSQLSTRCCRLGPRQRRHLPAACDVLSRYCC
jgi:hypothetical protein